MYIKLSVSCFLYPLCLLVVSGKSGDNELLKFQVSAAQFLDSLSLSVGHNSVFAGSFGKLMFAKPSPAGYLQSLAELTDVGYSNSSHPTPNILPTISSIPSPLGTRVGNQTEMVYPENKLPRMPPWFSRCGAQKLYKAVSGILRLVSVSLIIGNPFSSLLFYPV